MAYYFAKATWILEGVDAKGRPIVIPPGVCNLETNIGDLGKAQGALVDSSYEAAVAERASRTASASISEGDSPEQLAVARPARRNRRFQAED